MSYVPVDELKEREGITFAPMIDFLFLMLAFFASLAVTRVAMKDTDINLVKTKSELPSTVATRDTKLLHISILENGQYKWITEIRDHPMASPKEIALELQKQYQKGLLPQDKSKTKILLHIDRKAKWESILKVLVAIRETGFDARPIYEPEGQ